MKSLLAKKLIAAVMVISVSLCGAVMPAVTSYAAIPEDNTIVPLYIALEEIDCQLKKVRRRTILRRSHFNVRHIHTSCFVGAAAI